MTNQNSKKRLIIVDCDPGIDDALALLFLFKNLSGCTLLGITAVAGNVGVELTSLNTIRICTLAGIKVPVYAGAGVPLSGYTRTAAAVHGADGLGGVSLPAGYGLQADSAQEFLLNAAAEHSGELEILALGPLTNLARAMLTDSAFTSRLKGITLMGGALEGGNVTPHAEFNIFADAEAANVVYQSGVPITMVGLDVTRKALLGSSVAQRWRAHSHPVIRAAGRILADYRSGADGPDPGSFILHDPLAAAGLLDSSILTRRPCRITVETGTNDEYGRTIASETESHDIGHTTVAVDADITGFVDWFIRSIEVYES